jgi:predicted phage terminase large subunit-like protein
MEEDEYEQIVLRPCSRKQQLMLMDNETDILIAGGGAGSGKSHLSLMKALQFCEDPAARVGILRLSYPMLKGIGGLVDESKHMYRPFGGEWCVQPLEWKMANGAVIKFMACPDNLAELQGLQFTNIILDEAAEFSLEAVLMLKSRLRGARYKGKLSMTLTCNPSRTSYLYDWVSYSLDPETGVPKPGTEDITRWFVMLNNKITWGDSPQQLYDEHGFGMKLGVNFIPVSVRYIPMTIYDNPILLKNNPGYLANLLAGTRVFQLRFLHGSWTAVVEGASVFDRNWVKFVDHAPVNPANKVRSWDLAHSVPSESYPNPDYTAGVLMSRTRHGSYCIEHVKRFRKLTDGVVKEIVDTSSDDGRDITVTIPRDNGGGKAASSFFLRTFAEEGMSVRGIPISGHTSKMQRFLPFCTLAESGCVTMVRGDWNEDFLTELEHFTGAKTEKNDQVDSCADAFNVLAKQVLMPTMKIPDMTMPSIIPRIQ